MWLSWGSKGVMCPSSPSLMFWTNWNEQHPSIMRATLSGANVLIIIDQDIRTPNGLAIDHKAEKIYFSDATLDKIERCEYDGSHRYVSLRPVRWGGECPNWGWSVARGKQSCFSGAGEVRHPTLCLWGCGAASHSRFLLFPVQLCPLRSEDMASEEVQVGCEKKFLYGKSC